MTTKANTTAAANIAANIAANHVNAANHLNNLRGVPNLPELLAGLEDSHYIHANCLTPGHLEGVRAYMAAAGAVINEPSQYDRGNKEKKRERMAGLIVPGMSEIVELYDIRISRGSGDGRYCLDIYEHLYLAINNRIYSTGVTTWGRPEPVALAHPYDISAARQAAANGWEYSEPEPNRIGKATAKKLAAWVEYIDRREASAAEYVGAEARAVSDLLAQIEAAGLEYQRKGTEIKILNGPFSMVCRVYGGEIVCRRPEFYSYGHDNAMRDKFPGMDPNLAFILNAKLTF